MWRSDSPTPSRPIQLPQGNRALPARQPPIAFSTSRGEPLETPPTAFSERWQSVPCPLSSSVRCSCRSPHSGHSLHAQDSTLVELTYRGRSRLLLAQLLLKQHRFADAAHSTLRCSRCRQNGHSNPLLERDLELDQIATRQLAVDGDVEQSQIGIAL